MENLFNVKQAAFILKVHPLTLRRYIKEGKLKAMRVGGNIRIKEKDLNSFNKEFEPAEKTKNSSPFRVSLKPAKVFTDADPLLRLKGRGAAISFTEEKSK